MTTISKDILFNLRAHAQEEFPRESCGLVVVVRGRELYMPCKNVANSPTEHFILDPEDYARVEDMGEITAIVHSHPNVSSAPSEADKVMCESTDLLWHIVHVSIPDGADKPLATDITSLAPNGYKSPLVGRPFAHGILDCYALIRDWYRDQRGVELPDYERRDEWWNPRSPNFRGESLYMDNFMEAGFEPIKGPLQVGDIILMQIRAKVPNHAAVYIGDGLILHHVYNRLSSRDVYDGYWQENTRMIVRQRA